MAAPSTEVYMNGMGELGRLDAEIARLQADLTAHMEEVKSVLATLPENVGDFMELSLSSLQQAVITENVHSLWQSINLNQLRRLAEVLIRNKAESGELLKDLINTIEQRLSLLEQEKQQTLNRPDQEITSDLAHLSQQIKAGNSNTMSSTEYRAHADEGRKIATTGVANLAAEATKVPWVFGKIVRSLTA